MEEIRSHTSDYDDYYPEDDHKENTMRLAEDDYYYDDELEDDDDGYGRRVRHSDYDGPTKMEKITTALSILAGIIIVGIIIFLAVKIIGNKLQTSDNPDTSSSVVVNDTTSQNSAPVEVEMPTVVGSDIDSARNALTALGLNVLVDFSESDTIASGIVMSADVQPGTKILSGTNVNLLVSSGTDSVEMPDVTGKPISEAKLTLELSGFTVMSEEASSDEVPQGYVISQNPDPGVMAAKGVAVTITVSVGPTDVKVKVPGIIGLDEADATVTLIENDLSIGHITYVPSDAYPEGTVCSQSIAEGSFVGQSTVVDFEVSSGAEKHTYKCNLSVTAPTPLEAPDYIPGTEVRLKLVGSDGKVLLDQVTKEFPYMSNFYGIGCPSGILTVTYTVTTEPTTNADGTVVPGGTVEKSFTREIVFTQEDA